MALLGALCLCGLLAGVAAAPALATSSASVAGGTVTLAAAAGDTDGVTVSFAAGTYTIGDTAGVSAGAGCTQSGPTSVSCAATGLTADLGDMNDELTISSSGPGTVEVKGGDGDDKLTGGPGPERLRGDGGKDTLSGGKGDDTLASGGGDDSLDGGEGDDVFEDTGIGSGTDAIKGGPGNDRLSAGDMSPPAGEPAGTVTQIYSGGPGRDSVGYSSTTAPVVVTLDGQAGDGKAGERDEIGADVEDLTGGRGGDTLVGNELDNAIKGGAGDDVLTGGAGSDTLEGGAPGLAGADGDDRLKGEEGDDKLTGEGGDDTLEGGPGSDAMNGGEGRDTADYQSLFEAVEVTLDGLANDGRALELDNVGLDVENVRGGRLGDTLSGSDASNVLEGGSGEDYLDGAAGPDDLAGGDSGDVLRSRDGTADRVSCGAGPDFVVADAQDAPEADCDQVDNGANQRPAVGETAVVEPVSGTLGMTPAGIQRVVPLRDAVKLPVRSRVDARNGLVKLTSARGRRRRQAARLAAALFQILQRKGRRPVTDLVLKGGDFGQCRAGGKAAGKPGGAAAAARRKRRTVRRLFGNGRGRFRTRGRFSSATVRGTRWLVEDRCDGTLTRVRRGSAIVRDFVRRRTVVVRAGHSYLARAPGTRKGR